jgi:RimJ/RimL family protein N-acetyltransferase
VVPFRAVVPGDAPALQRLHDRCSDRSIELRFLGHLGSLSDRKAARLARPEDGDRLALAAVDPGRPDEIVAVVRFEREAGGETAEYAALVEDRWQGVGLGQALTDLLMEAARDRGIRRLHALGAPGNERMLRLLRGLGLPTTRVGREEGAELLEVDLGDPWGPGGLGRVDSSRLG